MNHRCCYIPPMNPGCCYIPAVYHRCCSIPLARRWGGSGAGEPGDATQGSGAAVRMRRREPVRQRAVGWRRTTSLPVQEQEGEVVVDLDRRDAQVVVVGAGVGTVDRAGEPR